MNAKPTAQVMRKMATVCRTYAENFENAACDLEESEDFTVCGQVLTDVLNLLQSLRLDLLIMKPLREYMKDSESSK